MPSIHDNYQSWNIQYPWPRGGEEWSESWGGAEAQWYGAILPRIQAFLPCDSILEIGPGFGRWTEYLSRHVRRSLIGVDLSPKCAEACTARFANNPNMRFCANDGTSLAMVPDGSIDFVFSFDTLVHAEGDVIESYLRQIAAKLRPNGAGFIHHSNFAEFHGGFALAESVPEPLKGLLFQRDFVGPTHWRAHTTTARIFESHATAAGLRCIGQELINWGTEALLIDCFSLITPATSDIGRANQVMRNPQFMKEAELIRTRAAMYSRTSLGRP